MERHNRFFVEDLAAEVVTLSVGEAHHAMHVLRLGAGDAAELFDGRGGLADGTIVEARHGKVSVRLLDRHLVATRHPPVIHLAFAVPKGKRLDWLLEKATELAVGSLTPVSFDRSVVEPGELAGAKRERWLGHCAAAAKQSGLAWLPELHEPLPLKDFLARFAQAGQVGLAGSADTDAVSVRTALASTHPDPAGEICLLVGPEGGMTDAEYAAARDAGFILARLGGTILRTETACIALIAAVTALKEGR
jgi:16S rRNA (uracil1498-N3)-methyltransferase